MKAVFGKILGSFVVCMIAHTSCMAAGEVIGRITIPRPQNGANGDSAMQIWCKENPNETCSVENFLAKIKGPKGDDGQNATDFCEKLDSARQAKTVKTSVREYSPYTRGDDGYAIEVGGFQTTIEYCSGSGQGFEADKCETIPAASTAEKDLPAMCNGTVKKCTRGDTGDTYYMCDGAESCYSSTSTRTPHGGRTSDENATDGVVYTTVGYVTTTVSRGCRGNGNDVITETFTREDDCADPKVISTRDSISYVYYTCSYSSGGRVVTYTLRKPLEPKSALYDLTQKMNTDDANTRFLSLSTSINAKADKSAVTTLQNTVDGHTTSLTNKLDKPSGGQPNQVLKWNADGTSLVWGNVSPNVQMETFGSTTAIYYCTKADGTNCETSGVTESNASNYGWDSLSISSLEGKSAYQVWVENGHANGTVAEFLESLKVKGDPGDPGDPGASAQEVWCEANDITGDDCTYAAYIAGVTGPQGPKGDKGNDGVDGKDGKDACQTYTYERDSANDTENEYAYKIVCADAE